LRLNHGDFGTVEPHCFGRRDLRDLRPISGRLGKKVAAIRPIYDLA